MYKSLYIHVPFCHLKCDYCAFYSLGYITPELQRQYLDKLENQCQALRNQCQPLRSIFIGGGTPTALSTDNLRRLLDIVNQNFTLTPDCEWSSEANPESLSQEKISVMASGGINRFSIGVQSFLPEERKTIGRQGDIQHLADAVRELHIQGVKNINMDFIYMIPGQTVESFTYSLEQALELEPTHISAYALTLEERTPLAKHFHELDDQDFLDFWNAADGVLGKAGLKRYEISNFARENRRCRHNHEIWHGQTYLGLGPAATSFDGVDRFTQAPSLQKWLKDTPPDVDHITPVERACEILAFGMRTLQGWNFQDFFRVTNRDPMELRGRELTDLCQQGLITLTDQEAKPTQQGLIFNDDVLMKLI